MSAALSPWFEFPMRKHQAVQSSYVAMVMGAFERKNSPDERGNDLNAEINI